MKRVVILLLCIVSCTLSIDLMAQFSNFGGGASSSSQNSEQDNKPATKQLQGDLFRGLSVHADIGSPIISLMGGFSRCYELQLDVNLYRRIYPIFEIGYATATKEAMSGVVYNTKAPFFRLGINYGLLKPFKDDGEARSVRSYPFVGLRYAMTPITYSIYNVSINDSYWGTSSVYDSPNNLDYAGWVELVGGVRVDIFNGLTLGWSIRMKTLLHTSAADKTFVWYVPGYGKSSGMGIMFNYTIGYTFYSGQDTKRKE